MKNKDRWVPSKYVYQRGRLVSSRDKTEVWIGSRLVTDLSASLYDRYLPQYARGKLIDLGCGKVPLYEVYKDHISTNICVDWENTQHKNTYLDYECDLSQSLPFSDGEFNTIILSDVLEHIAVPENFWHEMSRILAQEGKVIGNTPFYYGIHEAPYDYYRYTEHAFRRFAEVSGFNFLVLKPIGGTPEILADIFAKHLQFIPIIGEGLAVAVQYSALTLGKTSIGNKASEETGKVFPLGYFFVAEKIVK